jgi:predicted metalloprotease with PDZ domain
VEQPVPEPIRYLVDLRDRVHHLVHVTLTVPADLADGARLVLPVWTPGSYVVRDYARHVQSIAAVDTDGAEVALTMDSRTSWRLPHGTRGPVEVTYELYANELTVRTNHVDDHHALLIPAATFVTVDAGADRPHEVTIPPTPDGHRTWSLLPPAGDGVPAHTSVAEHRDHLIDSAFEVGDLPVVDYEVSGVPHRFVWSGHGPAPDLDRVARDARAIGDAAVELFGGELPIRSYTFLCAAWDTGGGGLEHRDGAVLQIPVRVGTDAELYARFQSLVAHEYFHLWNVKRLVPADLVRPFHEGPTHSPSLWVAEGWTAYYDELLPTRAGLWTARRYLDTLRDAIRGVMDAPGARRQPLRQASFEAWTKHYVRDENTVNVATNYYAHGALVALETDLRLRAATPGGDGFDDVLRLLWKRHHDTDEGYSEQDVLDAVATVGGDDLAALVDLRVGRAGLPDLGDEVVAAVGLRWRTDTAPTPPDLGIVVGEDDHAVTATSVLRDRPAWQAGITGGDELIAVNGRRVGRGQLDHLLRTSAPGDTVEVTVARGPRVLTLPVTLGDRRPGRQLIAVDDPSDAQRGAFARWTGRQLTEL